MELFDTKSMEELRKTYRGFVEEALQKQGRERDARWSESIAVGNEAFVRETKERLGIRAVGREVMATPKKAIPSMENMFSIYRWRRL